MSDNQSPCSVLCKSICIAVTDRRGLGRPIRFVSKRRGKGRPSTTDNRPTLGRDGSVRTEDRIRYFATAAEAAVFLAAFPIDRKRLYTLWGPRGPIAAPPETVVDKAADREAYYQQMSLRFTLESQ
jgi:hypothetical protein